MIIVLAFITWILMGWSAIPFVLMEDLKIQRLLTWKDVITTCILCTLFGPCIWIGAFFLFIANLTIWNKTALTASKTVSGERK